MRDDEQDDLDAEQPEQKPSTGEFIQKAGGSMAREHLRASKAAADAAGAAGSAAAGGTAAAGASAVAGGTAAAGNAVAGSAAASGAAAATGAAASSVGAAAGGVGAVVGEAGAMSQAVASGDGLGAVDSGVRAGAVIAASAVGTPVVGAAVGVALQTREGRAATRLVTWLIVGIAAMLVMTLIVAGAVIGGAASMLASAASGQAQNCGGTGSSVLVGDASEQVAVDVMTQAYKAGLGQEGAIIGLMTGLAESGLTTNETDALQSSDTPAALRSVGTFQQKPFYWANEVWPAGTTEGSAAFNDPQYVNAAVAKIKTPVYAADKFYARFESVPTLAGGAWKSMEPWVVAQTIQRSAFSDGSNYQKQYDKAVSLAAQELAAHPEIAQVAPAAPGAIANLDTTPVGTCNLTIDMDGVPAEWTMQPTGPSTFTDAGVVFPQTDLAVSRGLSYVGHPPCADGVCDSQCDHLAGVVWGYSSSGYESAKVHYYAMLAQGIAHPGDRNPPIGALLFWDSDTYGHVAVYVGNGMIVSNWSGPPNGKGVYLMPADRVHMPYLGWSNPVFRGAKISDSGFTYAN